METIISACISAGVTLLVCIITQRASTDKTIALIECKLDELTKKVDAHNQIIDRTYELEKRTDVQEEKIKVANHRIADLENQMKVGEKHDDE